MGKIKFTTTMKIITLILVTIICGFFVYKFPTLYIVNGSIMFIGFILIALIMI